MWSWLDSARTGVMCCLHPTFVRSLSATFYTNSRCDNTVSFRQVQNSYWEETRVCIKCPVTLMESTVLSSGVLLICTQQNWRRLHALSRLKLKCWSNTKNSVLEIWTFSSLSDADFYCLITCNQHLQHAFTGWNDPCLFSLFQCNLIYSAQNHNSSRLRAF